MPAKNIKTIFGQSGFRLSTCIAALMLSGCGGQAPSLLGDVGLTANNAPPAAKQTNGEPQLAMNDLQKATTYWGQQYAKAPLKLENALSYAKNLKALGQKRKALAVLQNAARVHSTDPELASEYGRLALEFDQIGAAEKLLAVADQPAKPDWRVISARGTVHAKRGQFTEAIPYYQRALVLSPNNASVLNNLAMAHAMKGDATQAETLLRQASMRPGESAKIRQNLALVLGLQGRYDEAKTTALANARTDTDVIRQIVKLQPKSQTPALRSSVAFDASATSGTWGTTVAAAPTAAPSAPTQPAFRGAQR